MPSIIDGIASGSPYSAALLQKLIVEFVLH